MPLTLEYDNKYSLWNDLVRGNADRLFIPTEDRVELNDRVPIDIWLTDKRIRLVVRGTVVGRRRISRRFAHGVFVHVEPEELSKCRRFLGLQPQDRYARVRRATRVHHEARVTITNPAGAGTCVTKNVSETGLFVTGGLKAQPGQRVSLELETQAAPLKLEAEVAWVAVDGESAGLHLVEVPEQVSAELNALIKRAIAARRAAHTKLTPVLVVDDEPQVLDFLSRALSQHGYEVFRATNGEDALSLVRELHPQLVVMDILIPGIDGVDICKYMRADSELADIPVIFISALDEHSLHSVADESGATDYLSKPLHLADLLDVAGYYLQLTND